VAMLLLTDRPEAPVQANDAARAAFEELELLADGETLELIEDWDAGFYEWAAAQSEVAETSG